MKPKNLLELFRNTVDKRGKDTCFRYKEGGKWQSLAWDEVFAKVLDLAGGLKKLGIQKGDRVCIFSRSRYEWTVADVAIVSCGGVTVPIYESSTPDQAAYILQNCEAKVAFVEDLYQLKKLDEEKKHLTCLKQIILFSADPNASLQDGIYTLDEIGLLGAGVGYEHFIQMQKELTGDSEFSYVYTSGTTGPPKGAMLTHGNILSELEGLQAVLSFSEKTESLLFLPLAHILARIVQYAQLERGFIQCYAESIDKLLDNIAEVKPHIMASVPRIFEKVHTRVMQGLEGASLLKKKIFAWAMKVGDARSHYLLENAAVPFYLKIQWPLVYQLVFSKLHQKMGGRIDYFISGGAPLSKEIAQFFHAAGFIILEGYGLTETSAAITCNSKKALKVGTVGKPVPGAEIKIADDGEILVKGEMVFKGYYKRSEDTSAAIDGEGWFHTGDIGVFDDRGFLQITDRKKDIIVTAAGKNVAPQNIENLIKTDPLISQVMVHGDKRKYLSALVTLDKEQIIHFATDHKIVFQTYSELVKHEKIYQLIKNRIEEKNKQLAKYESIKKFAILETDFSVETGELTPTMKVKRKFTSEKYKTILDEFYKE